MDNLPKIALIGRANVGKSTLFNRLTENRQAIVSTIPGTTRDRNYAPISWNKAVFELVDTGGVDIVHTVDVEKEILKQTNQAIKEAELLLLIVNVKDGLMPQDKEVAKLVRHSGKPVILVINKADSARYRNQATDFFTLGFKDYAIVSAANGTGTGDLLDQIVQKLPQQKKSTKISGQPIIKIALIGKPNVGKSSLINAILDNQRLITSPLPYTTRDAQDIKLDYQAQPYLLIDTAGVRKKNKIKNPLEKFSVDQSLTSIKRADVCLLITDVAEPLGQQDKTLADAILKSHKSIIMIANKWDLIANKNEKTLYKFIGYYQAFFPYLNFAPIIFVSALEKQRLKKILEVAKEVFTDRCKKISDRQLHEFLKKIIKKHPPARGKGMLRPRLYGLSQHGTNPPSFELFKDPRSDLHPSYLKFMEKQLRQQFGFLGTPLTIKYRKLH